MNFKKLTDAALSVVFPNRCKYCGEVITPKQEICSNCADFLPVIKEPVCLFCGHSKEDCACKQHKNDFNAVGAPFYYEGAIKKAIHRFKFEGRDFVADTLAFDMAETIRTLYNGISFDAVTFVPFSESEKKSRSFNQSELLAKKISEYTEIPFSDILVKLYDVPSQHTLPGKKRKGNVFGIYDTNPDAEIDGKTLLLVDDIKTTGSTLSECAKMLKIAGAKEVYAITVAITKTINK